MALNKTIHRQMGGGSRPPHGPKKSTTPMDDFGLNHRMKKKNLKVFVAIAVCGVKEDEARSIWRKQTMGEIGRSQAALQQMCELLGEIRRRRRMHKDRFHSCDQTSLLVAILVDYFWPAAG